MSTQGCLGVGPPTSDKCQNKLLKWSFRNVGVLMTFPECEYSSCPFGEEFVESILKADVWCMKIKNVAYYRDRPCSWVKWEDIRRGCVWGGGGGWHVKNKFCNVFVQSVRKNLLALHILKKSLFILLSTCHTRNRNCRWTDVSKLFLYKQRNHVLEFLDTTMRCLQVKICFFLMCFKLFYLLK